MQPDVRVQQQRVGADIAQQQRAILLQALERGREIGSGLMGRHVGERERAVGQRRHQPICTEVKGRRVELVEALDMGCCRHPGLAGQQHALLHLVAHGLPPPLDNLSGRDIVVAPEGGRQRFVNRQSLDSSAASR
jgi:hypothetical protein